MRVALGLPGLIRLAVVAALGVWLLGGCTSTTARAAQSDSAGHCHPCERSHPASFTMACYQR